MNEAPKSKNDPLAAAGAEHVESICLRFQAAWQAGQQPRIEDLVAAAPELERFTLLRRLLALEFAQRGQRGETLVLEEYCQRFPEERALVNTVFREAVASDGLRAEKEDSARLSAVETDPGRARANTADIPARLGRFQIRAKLGAGGFGVVYRAYDPDLQRDVAIKVAHLDRLALPADAEAYLAEARILASLDHPGIVPVYEVGRTDDGLCYLVAKFADGNDLKMRLDQGRPSLPESVEIVARVAEALHHAHQRGLVHRDIKPANILLDAKSNPIVVDFGLALREEEFGKEAGLAGTPQYMSPEQARGEGHLVDARSDVYSLGVVFYELLTGQRPFRGKNLDELLEQITTREPRPPRQLDDTIPKELDRICLRALAQRASERYSTAADLADDLRHWQSARTKEEGGRMKEESVSPKDSPIPASSSLVQPLKVVPRGLRSFDAADADFFLELLPGPRDRHGLPESLHFWKRRIEETDADHTFRVGVLYGPSGCGKSSLVKAGLLPRLAEQVLVVYVEATPAETESRLLKGLGKRCPGLPENLSLVEALAQLRRGRGLAAGKKVLLVLDQFEQWLHAQRNEPNTELMQALRQCDGQHVQCLLLVRDDFWLAVSRFLHELEIPLLEGHNYALVDLFDPLHARKVLGLFGAAYGRLPDNLAALTAEQERFLGQAVAELAQDGKIISVRLSLFADMIKGKPWTPATLKEVGGAEGVRVAFLEEKFGISTAPGAYRPHQKAARSVLQALLPEQGSDIKGHMRSYAELLAASGYAQQPRAFDALVRILDTELRLITPTDPEASGSDSAAPESGRYYQLTHDYLVPGLRQWLTRKQRETVRGRAELRLAERAALWTAKSENRHLPAWWEWANIRLFTRRRDWTPPQHTMMRTATRYHGWRGLTLAALLLLATGTGLETWRRVVEQNRATHVAGLVRGLLNANMAQVPGIINELEAHRAWADPLLREENEKAAPDSPQKLHTSLALLPVDPNQRDYLYNRLLDAAAHEVPVLRDALTTHKADLLDKLWTIVEQPAPGHEQQRLRAAGALASYDPDSPRWAKIQDQVANDVVSVPAVYLANWMASLRPVRAHLLAPLTVVFRNTKRREIERSLATDILADYAADQASVLAELLKDADDQQYAKLWPKLLPHREQALAPLRQELTKTLEPVWKDEPLDPAWKAPDASLQRQITEAHGLLGDRFALCQTLPLEQFASLADGLRGCGYRPIQFRPYAVGQVVQVAAVWIRDGRDWQLVQGVSAEELRKQDGAWREKGYVPLDVASYGPVPGTASEAERYAALWARPDAEIAETEMYVGVADGAPHTAAWQALRDKSFVPRTQTWLIHAGQTRHSAIWWKPGQMPDNPVYSVRYDELDYESQLTPSNLQIDVRLAKARATPPPGERDAELLAQAEKDLKAKPDNLNALYQRAQARFRLGQDAEAIADLTLLITKSPKTSGAYQYRALAHARMGKAIEAKADLGQFQKLSTNASSKAALDAEIAAYLGEDAEAMQRLDAAIAQNAKDSGFLYNAACAYAVAAQALSRKGDGETAVAPQPERAKAYAERAVALLQDAAANGYQNYRHIQTDADLDGLRGHPGFQALLRPAHFDGQYAAVWHASPALESTESHGLDPAAHLERCRELARQGYRPMTVTVLSLEAAQPLATASVWHRPVVPEAAKDALALRQAQAAVALLQLGQDELVWPLLRHSPDPRVRTYLIHRLSPLGTDAGTLLRRWEEERDVSIRRALLLCLGEFGEDKLPVPERQKLATALLGTYRDNPDPGLHGAVEWLLRRWGYAADLAKIDKEMVSPQAREGRRWYVNGQGQTLVLIPGPVEFWMGSPAQEPSRVAVNEPLHRKQIGRTFAMGTKEVTVEQFKRFRPTHRYTNQYSPKPEGPIINVTWYNAANYCNWLSAQEGIPESEWCYPQDVAEGKVLPPAYLGKTGYRLPTEAEWEYACRAGARTSRAYGVQDEKMLERYGWFLGNAENHVWPGGLLKPNDLGLFDMYGNVYEWCQEPAFLYRWSGQGRAIEDKEDILDIRENQSRLLRGGAFIHSALLVRSATRGTPRPSIDNTGAGFRVARTYR